MLPKKKYSLSFLYKSEPWSRLRFLPIPFDFVSRSIFFLTTTLIIIWQKNWKSCGFKWANLWETIAQKQPLKIDQAFRIENLHCWRFWERERTKKAVKKTAEKNVETCLEKKNGGFGRFWSLTGWEEVDVHKWPSRIVYRFWDARTKSSLAMITSLVD